MRPRGAAEYGRPRRAVIALVRAGLLAAALAALLAACGEKRDDGTTPVGAPSLPALSIKDDTPDLLLTWVDERGDTHSALRPSEVPEEGKPLVRVVVADREEGTRDPLYVVDLTRASADGSFEARAMSRREWEGILEKRREAYVARFAPKTAAPTAPPSGAPSAPPTAPTTTPPSGWS